MANFVSPCRSHNEFPAAPEQAAVPVDMYSPLQREMMEAANLKPAQVTQPKLITHLGPRLNYLVHGQALAYYLKLGMRVTRYHYGIRFRQKAFLKPYIQDLMEMRKRSPHKFEQQVFKVSSSFLTKPNLTKT